MRYLKQFLVSLSAATLASAADSTPHGAEESKSMGPVAFMWPPDRPWSAAADNTAPCGSTDGVGNRTDFPLTRGSIALVAQDEGWNISVSVAYSNDPREEDFQRVVIEKITEMDEGHMCYPLPDPPRDVVDGTNGTIRIVYIADFDQNKNETYYACSDVRYVNSASFTTQISCFNVSSENFTAADDTKSAGVVSASSQNALVAGILALGFAVWMNISLL